MNAEFKHLSEWKTAWNLVVPEMRGNKWRVIVIATVLLAVTVLNLLLPLATQLIIDKGILAEDLALVAKYSLYLLVLLTVKTCLELASAFLIMKLNTKIKYNLFMKVFHKLETVKLRYFEANESTKIFNNMNSDISILSQLFDSTSFSLISSFLTLLGGLVCIFLIDPYLAAITLLAIPLKYAVIYVFSHKNKKIVRSLIETNSRFAGWFADTLRGIKEVRMYNLYSQKEREMGDLKKQTFKLEIRSALFSSTKGSLDTIITQVLTTAIYFVGAYLILGGKLTLGSLIAFTSYTIFVMTPLGALINIKFIFSGISPAAQRLSLFFSEKTENANHLACRNEMFLIDSIEFRNVSYSQGLSTILDEVSFEVNKGDKVALVGENGSGKSTLIALMLGFLEPTEGSILINSKPITDYNLVELRERFSISEQGSHRFQETIKQNVCLGISSDNDQSILRILNEVGYAKEQLNESFLHSHITNLSSGEMQKLILARVIFQSRQVVILDEATSHIDQKTRIKIDELFETMFDDQIVIYVTHYEEMLGHMDKIICLEQGKIKDIRMPAKSGAGMF